MTRMRSLLFVTTVVLYIACSGVAFGLMGDDGDFEFTKSVDKIAAVWGDEVTYTYTVSNDNEVDLYNITITDDNGTPDDPSDDFTLGPIDKLSPGESEQLTATVPLTPMCGDQEKARVDLIAGQQYLAGEIVAYVKDDQLRVLITTQDGWKLVETHLYVNVGSECKPPAKAAPGRFTFKHDELNRATSDEYVIDLPDLEPGDVVTLAVHAVVEKLFIDDDDISHYQEETAWGEGEPLGTAWGMYFCFEICPPEPCERCVTNTAVVSAYRPDASGEQQLYWQDSDTATVCVFLSGDVYDVSGTVRLDQSVFGITESSPRANVPVDLFTTDGTLLASVATDAAGNYTFEGAPPKDLIVRVPLNIFIRGRAVYPLTSPDAAVSVVDEDVTDVDFLYAFLNSQRGYEVEFAESEPVSGDDPDCDGGYGESQEDEPVLTDEPDDALDRPGPGNGNGNDRGRGNRR